MALQYRNPPELLRSRARAGESPRLAPSEKQITAALIARWRALGLPGTLVAAIPNARAFGQPGLYRGLFDLLVLGPKVGAAFLELKTATGKLRPEQAEFKLCLITNNVPYAVTF